MIAKKIKTNFEKVLSWPPYLLSFLLFGTYTIFIAPVARHGGDDS
jgi:hypothetical protein